MKKYEWSHLNRLQLGKYAEYFVKMEFTRLGVDIYGAEVDDRGIDFIARTQDGRHYDVQVKSVHKSEYIFMCKSNFALRDNLLLAVVMFREGEEPRGCYEVASLISLAVMRMAKAMKCIALSVCGSRS